MIQYLTDTSVESVELLKKMIMMMMMMMMHRMMMAMIKNVKEFSCLECNIMKQGCNSQPGGCRFFHEHQLA